jgi:sugar lactone lactonase YvrE
MKRIALLLIISLAPAAHAQDMPLSQILIEGEGWTKSTGSRPEAKPPTTLSPDGSTAFRWVSGGFVEARQTKARESVPFAPYCPLRVKKGEAPFVTALTTDRDGRIYAATPLGIQVFDPTGRLCGVVRSPKGGTVYDLRFEGDRLVAWIGETKHTRRLRTAGGM